MRFSSLVRAALASLTAVATFSAVPALAAGGDIFDRGRHWCASTHPNHGTPQGFGPALDLGSPTDFRWPIYAPGDGFVEVYQEGHGWGKSLMWISADRRERIHMAHLDSYGAKGRVRAGDLIGRVGSTGHSTSPHVHSSRQMGGHPAPLILGGRVLRAGGCYVSRGPIPPTCFGREADLIGTARNDHLKGTPGPDVVVGGGGGDRIQGREGRDRICGGGGDDVLIGGAGRDALTGGGGANRIDHGPGEILIRTRRAGRYLRRLLVDW